MDDDGLPDHLLELKYLVGASTAAAIRARLALHCRCKTADQPLGQPRHSLYFDTPHQALLTGSQTKPLVRQRVRVRWNGPDEKLSCTVKYKRGNVVLRQRRARIEAARWPAILHEERSAAPKKLLKSGGFLDQVDRLGLEAVMHVLYRREAWTALDEDDLDIVFDRDLRCFPADGDPRLDFSPEELTRRCLPLDDAWTVAAEDTEPPVLMELTTPCVVPAWLSELIADFALVPAGASKYALAVAACATPVARHAVLEELPAAVQSALEPHAGVRARPETRPVLRRAGTWTSRILRRLLPAG